MDKRFAVGNFICELRQEKGFTQKELGDLLGVTNKAVSKWENGAAMPRLDTLHELAVILGCTQEELFLGHRIDGTEPEEDKPSVTEGYISVVQRCDACHHEPEIKHKVFGVLNYKPSTGYRCKKCGAKIKLKSGREFAVWLLFPVITTIVNMCSVLLADDLGIVRLQNYEHYGSEWSGLYKQLLEYFPHLRTVLWIAELAILVFGVAVSLVIIALVIRLLIKKAKYKIIGYPHSEDGKIVF